MSRESHSDEVRLESGKGSASCRTMLNWNRNSKSNKEALQRPQEHNPRVRLPEATHGPVESRIYEPAGLTRGCDSSEESEDEEFWNSSPRKQVAMPTAEAARYLAQAVRAPPLRANSLASRAARERPQGLWGQCDSWSRPITTNATSEPYSPGKSTSACKRDVDAYVHPESRTGRMSSAIDTCVQGPKATTEWKRFQSPVPSAHISMKESIYFASDRHHDPISQDDSLNQSLTLMRNQLDAYQT